MRIILALLISLSFPAIAQVYKWTDENGNTHFGAQPPPGKQKQVDVRPASGSSSDDAAESDIIRQARELERRKQAEALSRSQQDYSQQVGSINERSESSPDYLCTGAENRLKSARERWEQQKLQGWTISEKRYHEQRIKDAQRHRANICR